VLVFIWLHILASSYFLFFSHTTTFLNRKKKTKKNYFSFKISCRNLFHHRLNTEQLKIITK